MPYGHHQRHHGAISRRRKRAARPGCEALEGRAMLAASVLDPGFGQRGVTLGPLAAGPLGTYVQDSSSVAVQADGKVVVATGYTLSGAKSLGLAVERYDADGKLDASFGVGGTTVVPVPAGFSMFSASPDVTVGPDGSIVLAAGLAPFSPTSGAEGYGRQSLIARLTPAGALDATFAQGGEYQITLPGASFGHVAVQPDGKVVAAGSTGTFSDTLNVSENTPQITVIRLTTTGTLDTSFNGIGRLDVLPAALNTHAYDTVGALALAPDGQVLVASSLTDPIVIDPVFNADGTLASSNHFATVLSRVAADGTPVATFGTGGSLDISNRIGDVSGLVVQPDGKAVLSGQVASTTASNFDNGLVRLLADGSVDPTFRTAPLDVPGASNFNGFVNGLALGADGGFTTVGSVGTNGIRAADGNYATSGPSLLVVKRYQADGTPDARFGTGGRYSFYVAPTAIPGFTTRGLGSLSGVAVTPAGQVVVAGRTDVDAIDARGQYASKLGDQLVLARLNPTAKSPVVGDYDGDGKADLAAELTRLNLFAIRPSGGGGDRVGGSGLDGLDDAIPLTGDYDGDGKADEAVYLANSGILAYHPSSGGPNVYVNFGSAGIGQSIPVSGDFDGDGKTDVAVYLPAYAVFAIDPSGGGSPYLVPFGTPGDGNTIPAVGDYDGDGKADVAAYLPASGTMAIRPSSGGPDVYVPFGSAGLGQSIPAPGDYDGDGKTDIAVYLPASGEFAVHPSGGGLNYLDPIGRPNAPATILGDPSASVPVVEDYDGDGKADPAVYIQADGLFAYRPSAGGADVIQQFGQPGPDVTLPAAGNYYLSAQFVPRIVVPLTTDDVAGLAAPTAGKKKA